MVTVEGALSAGTSASWVGTVCAVVQVVSLLAPSVSVGVVVVDVTVLVMTVVMCVVRVTPPEMEVEVLTSSLPDGVFGLARQK